MIKYILFFTFSIFSVCVNGQISVPQSSVLVEKVIALKEVDSKQKLSGLKFNIMYNDARIDAGSLASKDPTTDSSGSVLLWILRMKYFPKAQLKLIGDAATKYTTVDKTIKLGKENSTDTVIVYLKKL